MPDAKRKTTKAASLGKRTKPASSSAKQTGKAKSKKHSLSTKKESNKSLRANKSKRRNTKKPIGTCFVLLPFKEPFNTYYTLIIKPAVIAAGLNPLRGDSL